MLRETVILTAELKNCRVKDVTERHWERLLGAAIPIVWIWFALLGIAWNVMFSLFIAIAVTILFGTLYAIIDPTKAKTND